MLDESLNTCTSLFGAAQLLLVDVNRRSSSRADDTFRPTLHGCGTVCCQVWMRKTSVHLWIRQKTRTKLPQQFWTFQPRPLVDFSWTQAPAGSARPEEAGWLKTTQTYWKTDGTESAPVLFVVFLYPTKEGKAHLNRKQKSGTDLNKNKTLQASIRPNKLCCYTIKFILIQRLPIREQMCLEVW